MPVLQGKVYGLVLAVKNINSRLSEGESPEIRKDYGAVLLPGTQKCIRMRRISDTGLHKAAMADPGEGIPRRGRLPESGDCLPGPF